MSTYLRESSGNKSSICGSNNKTGDEETTGYACSIGPAGKYEVDKEHNPQSR